MIHYTANLNYDAITIDSNRGVKEEYVTTLTKESFCERRITLKDLNARIIDLMIQYSPDASISLFTQHVFAPVLESDTEVIAKLRLGAWLEHKQSPNYEEAYKKFEDTLFEPLSPENAIAAGLILGEEPEKGDEFS